jgi:hypothetical protein
LFQFQNNATEPYITPLPTYVMALAAASRGWWLITIGLCLALLPGKAAAFGAGNIPSIAQVRDQLHDSGTFCVLHFLTRFCRSRATTGDMEVRDLYKHGGVAATQQRLTPSVDIEDMLTTIAFLNGKKWTSMLIKRVYFGNWLRDYSQAVDVGSLKGVNAATIRVLVWATVTLDGKFDIVTDTLRSGFFLSWPMAMRQKNLRSPKVRHI